MISVQELRFQQCDGSHLKELREISETTFANTFAHLNNPTDFRQYLDHAFSEQKIKSELENPDSSFYFCHFKTAIVGYVKLNFSTAQTDIHDEKSLEIERIYVLKDWQGKGIGLALMMHAIEIAKANSLDYIWLGVWEKNPKAISFYTRFGFQQFDTHSFLIGEDLQTDVLMRLSVSGPDI